MSKITKYRFLSILIIGLVLIVVGCSKSPHPQHEDGIDDQMSKDSVALRFSFAEPNFSNTDTTYANEKNVESAVLFVFPQGAELESYPKLKYVLSAEEITSGVATIPVANEETITELFDYYLIVNSLDEDITNQDYPNISKGDLLSIKDINIRSRYNRVDYNFVKNGDIETFVMSGEALGQSHIDSLNIAVNRTVARVMVTVNTDRALFDDYNTAFHNDSISITYSRIYRGNREANLFGDLSVDSYEAPHTIQDTLVQLNGNHSSGYNAIYAYYLFPTLERGAVSYPYQDATNNSVKLRIELKYFTDKADDRAFTTMYFDLPILGGNDPSIAKALKRNHIYNVQVTIEGLNGFTTVSPRPPAPPMQSYASQLDGMVITDLNIDGNDLKINVGGK